MVDRGMTHQQIADKVSSDEGVAVSREAVSAALSRAGMTNRVRYEDEIPWRVKVEHQGSYDLWMLRLAARVDRGLGVSKTEARRLQVWKDRLNRNGAVIHYEPESEEGFWPVHREAGIDLGLIREPDRRKRRPVKKTASTRRKA
jgi:hypothetical protein